MYYTIFYPQNTTLPRFYYIGTKKKPKDIISPGFKSGGYLLSHNKCTTIGVAELNDPVRNGKGWDLSAITTLINSQFTMHNA